MTSFYKVSGAGNDFIAVLGPPPEAAAVRAWCRRGLSLGADGVIALARGADPGAVSMRHWNADGGRSDLCLNGSRCAARLAAELGWDDGGRVSLETDAGRLECTVPQNAPDGTATAVGGGGRWADRARLVLPFEVEAPTAVRLDTPFGRVPGHHLGVGVPHLVVLAEDVPGSPASQACDPAPDLGAFDLATFDLGKWGPPLRAHPDLGPEGANLDVVRYLSRRRLELRTFERGVEGETLACGTGAVAAVRVGLEKGSLELPVTVATAGGFELRIDRRGDATTLEGDARLVARGELLRGALAGDAVHP